MTPSCLRCGSQAAYPFRQCFRIPVRHEIFRMLRIRFLCAARIKAADRRSAGQSFQTGRRIVFSFAADDKSIRQGIPLCQQLLVTDQSHGQHVLRELLLQIADTCHCKTDAFIFHFFSQFKNPSSALSFAQKIRGCRKDDFLPRRDAVFLPELRRFPGPEKISIDSVGDDTDVPVLQEGLSDPVGKPLRRRDDFKKRKITEHFLLLLQHFRRAVERQRRDVIMKPGASAASVLPSVALIGMTAFSGVHEFTVEGPDCPDAFLLDIIKQRLQIDEIGMQFMDVDDVRLELVNETDQTSGRKMGPAAGITGEPRHQCMEIRFGIVPELQDILLFHERAASVADCRVIPVFPQKGIEIVDNLSGAAVFAVDINQ